MLILLLEPDAHERRNLSRALAREGYSVRAARDSREAVRLFLDHPADLLLVSQPEPALDGRIAFELLTAIKPALRVIVMSPAPSRRGLDQRLSIRVEIEKPSGLPALFGLLRQLFQRQHPSRHDEGARSSRVEDICPSPMNQDKAPKPAGGRTIHGPTRPIPTTDQH